MFERVSLLEFEELKKRVAALEKRNHVYDREKQLIKEGYTLGCGVPKGKPVMVYFDVDAKPEGFEHYSEQKQWLFSLWVTKWPVAWKEICCDKKKKPITDMRVK